MCITPESNELHLPDLATIDFPRESIDDEAVTREIVDHIYEYTINMYRLPRGIEIPSSAHAISSTAKLCKNHRELGLKYAEPPKRQRNIARRLRRPT